MPTDSAIVGFTVGKRRPRPPAEPQPKPLPTRDRVDMRVDPAWLARVERQADRLGISVSAYIRQAVTRQVETDESTDPGLPG